LPWDGRRRIPPYYALQPPSIVTEEPDVIPAPGPASQTATRPSRWLDQLSQTCLL